MERDEQEFFRRTAMAAGVTSDEMYFHPVHGWCVSANGARKMAAKAPDTKGKLELLADIRRIEESTT